MKKIIAFLTFFVLLVSCTPRTDAPPVVHETPTREPAPTLIPPTYLAPSVFPKDSVDIQISSPFGKGTISDLVWSPDGATIVVSGSTGIRFYAADTLEETRFIPADFLITSLAFNPDGKLLVTGSADLPFSSRASWRRGSPFVSQNNFVQLWEVESGNLLSTLEAGFSYVTSVAFSPDGTLIASGSMYPDDNAVRIWETDSVLLGDTDPWQLHKEHTRGIFGIDFSPDGNLLLTGAGDNSARLWDVYGEKMQSILMYRPEAKVKVFAVDYSPNGQTVALAGADFFHNTPTAFLELWDAQSGDLLAELDGHESSLDSVAFSPDGRLLASGGSYPDNLIHIWDSASGQKVRTLQGHASGVRNVAFSPDGNILASSGWDGVLNLWDVNTGELLNSTDEHTSVIHSAAISPDGRILATGGDEGFIRLWDVETGQKLRTLDTLSVRVTVLAFHPDGTTLFAGTDEPDFNVQVWGVLSEERIATYFGHTNFVQVMALSLDGSVLATGGALGDNAVRIWHLNADAPTVQVLEGHTRSVKSLAFSADGLTLATGDGTGIIRLVDVETGKIRQSIEAHDCAISALYIDAEGELVSGGCGGIVRVWDASNGSLLHQLEGIDETVSRLGRGYDAGEIFIGFVSGDIWLWRAGEAGPSVQITGTGGEIQTVLSQPDDIRILMDMGGGMSRLWDMRR